MTPEPAQPEDGPGEPAAVSHAYPPQSTVPPETAEIVSSRRCVILSFWLCVLFLGLPAWWMATSVYQASLPIPTMLEWDSGKFMPQSLPLDIPVQAEGISLDSLRELTTEIQNKLDEGFSRTYLSPRLAIVGNDSRTADELPIVFRLSSDSADPQVRLDTVHNSVDVSLPPQTWQSRQSEISALIYSTIDALLQDEVATLTSIVTGENAPKGDVSHDRRLSQLTPISASHDHLISSRNTVAFKPAPTYHLTFSLFSPVGTPSSWEIRQALDSYIKPALHSLGGITNFTVDTQLQLYSHLPSTIKEPRFDPESNRWLLDRNDLNGFINSAEWPLSPSIGAGPTIHFAIFVPSPRQQPLGIDGTDSTSWIVPQWGSVFILNPSTSSTTSPVGLAAAEIEPAMTAFSKHLFHLLGLMPLPIQPSVLFQISSHRRSTTTQLTTSACTTLGAIVRLTRSLPSIAIPNSVASAVSNAIDELGHAVGAIEAGDYGAGLRHAQRANVEAEKAFFDPAMVSQAYFPDEHKVAVYLPLLGPASVPLVMAVLKEIKAAVLRRKGSVSR